MTDTLLVTGAHGQVGHALTRLAGLHGFKPVALGSSELDITDAAAVERAAQAHAPAAVVNAAAYTGVDKAEEEEARAQAVNADGPAHLARVFGSAVPLLHFSTDYVFDGEGKRPYREDDSTAPLGAYGRTKLAGEKTILAAARGSVMRTAWVYSDHGGNFLKTMLRVGRERGALSVVDDQIGTPTHAADIAEAALVMLRKQMEAPGLAGLYHYTASGQTSWHGFAAAIFEALESETGERVGLSAIPSSDYPTPAARPAYSVLDGSRIERTFGVTRPDWRAPVAGTVAEVLKERV
ncbi:dTDP-4-dehydrorhamnose reductase [Parvularcula oceani]|uniref:dTDP-4-dehydrorhamnose reductase n=1 Tax=Parvularcula oceani TaxID=1247963 RepID=UPI0004E1041C|nr:dTDP-4-dehydrorhamnose reductase [Parvularcula oceani]